jgi:hypothetical protein
MTTTQDAGHAQIVAALEATAGQRPEEQSTAIQNALVPLPTQGVADLLWKVVVFTLARIAVLSLLALVVLLAIGKWPT